MTHSYDTPSQWNRNAQRVACIVRREGNTLMAFGSHGVAPVSFMIGQWLRLPEIAWPGEEEE